MRRTLNVLTAKAKATRVGSSVVDPEIQVRGGRLTLTRMNFFATKNIPIWNATY